MKTITIHSTSNPKFHSTDGTDLATEHLSDRSKTKPFNIKKKIKTPQAGQKARKISPCSRQGEHFRV